MDVSRSCRVGTWGWVSAVSGWRSRGRWPALTPTCVTPSTGRRLSNAVDHSHHRGDRRDRAVHHGPAARGPFPRLMRHEADLPVWPEVTRDASGYTYFAVPAVATGRRRPDRGSAASSSPAGGTSVCAGQRTVRVLQRRSGATLWHLRGARRALQPIAAGGARPVEAETIPKMVVGTPLWARVGRLCPVMSTRGASRRRIIGDGRAHNG